jgi:hypothetical protein
VGEGEVLTELEIVTMPEVRESLPAGFPLSQRERVGVREKSCQNLR